MRHPPRATVTDTRFPYTALCRSPPPAGPKGLGSRMSHGSGRLPAGRLSGRIAVITGASRGIGAAVARRFAAEGAQLLLIARTVGALEELDDTIRAAGGKQPVLIPHDLRDFDGLDRLGASVHERFGKLDILVEIGRAHV